MLFGGFLLYVFVATASAAVNITQILTELPSCSLDCILTGLSSSPAILSDPTLVCGNNTLQASLSACVQGKCNYAEQAQVATVTHRLCEGQPVESRSTMLAIVGLVSVPITLLAVGLRCYSRFAKVRQFGYDDCIVVVAALLLVALLVLDVYNGWVNGYGRHYWNLDPSKVTDLLKLFYVSEMIYLIVIKMVKISILFLYRRVFPGYWFKIANSVSMAIVIASGIAVTFAVVFQCRPVAGAWNKTIPSECVNLNKLAYATSGIDIVLDFLIIALPIPHCLRLNMNKRKKFNVLFMFSMGSLGCLTSLIRLKYLVAFGHSLDPSYDNVLPAAWSFIEICIATICACLPALRCLFARWFPAIFDIHTTNASSKARPTFAHKRGPSYNKRAITDLDDDVLYSPAFPPPPTRPAPRDSREWNLSKPGADFIPPLSFPAPLHYPITENSNRKQVRSATASIIPSFTFPAPQSRPTTSRPTTGRPMSGRSTIGRPTTASSTMTKVWINPRRNSRGEIIEPSHEKQASDGSNDMSIFALQGPRMSDEETVVIGLGLPMSDLNASDWSLAVEQSIRANSRNSYNRADSRNSYNRLASVDDTRYGKDTV